MSYTYLVERLSVERKQLQGSLAAFTRYIHKHFRRRNWPLAWAEAPAENPEYKTEYFYTMDKDTAERWQEVRAKQSYRAPALPAPSDPARVCEKAA